MLGQTLARELFDEQSPVGQEVYVNDVPLRVLGVLSRKGADIIGEDQDDLLVAPWTTVKFRISSAAGSADGARDAPRLDLGDSLSSRGRRYPRGRQALFPSLSPMQAIDTPQLDRLSNVDSILVRTVSTEEIPAAMEQITGVLRQRHRIAPGEPADFAVQDFTEVVHAVKSTVGLVAGLLICVSLISLVVGGIGIMNIMLVTVTERYREIGLRMAVGRGHAISSASFLSKPSCSACSAARSASWPAEELLGSFGYLRIGRRNPRSSPSWPPSRSRSRSA